MQPPSHSYEQDPHTGEQRAEYAAVFFFALLLLWGFPNISAQNTKGEGALYLTLENAEPGYIPSLFIYTFDQEKLSPLLHDGNINTGAGVSNTRGEVAYVSQEQEGSAPAQIRTIAFNTGEVTSVTGDTLSVKRDLRWSPDGEMLAFSAIPADSDVRTVYVVKEPGRVVRISSGSQPRWSPDSRTLLFIHEDGVYAHALANGSDARVMPLDTETSRNTLFDVSPNGRVLALADKLKGEIHIFSINSWEPFSLTETRTLPMHALSLLFSPDSQILAIAEETLDRPYPEQTLLTLYSLQHETSRTLIPLGKYDRNTLSLDDWK